MRQSFCLLLSLLICTAAMAQKSLLFNQAWVWDVWDKDGKQYEMVIYHNGTDWLFTSESYSKSPQQIDWILGKANGEYWTAYTDDSNKKKLKKEKIHFQSISSLPVRYEKSNKTESYGELDMGPLLRGNGYTIAHENTDEVSTVYLGRVKSDFRPITYFNTVFKNIPLLVQFPIDLPANTIPLAENYSNLQPYYHFKMRSHTEYYIHPLEYTLVNLPTP